MVDIWVRNGVVEVKKYGEKWSFFEIKLLTMKNHIYHILLVKQDSFEGDLRQKMLRIYGKNNQKHGYY